MNIFLIFFWVWTAFIAMSFWEAYVEGRNPWDKRKLGWTIRLSQNISLPAYHFFVFVVMWPLLLTLPLIIYGWDLKLFGILVSTYATGVVIEDFLWWVINPAVEFKEFWSSLSDFYPWIKVSGKKIIPVGYLIGPFIALLSWYFLWR